MRRNKSVLLAKQAHKLVATTRATSSSPIRGNLASLLKQKPNARLLIIRSLGGIGDILMTTPGVRQLKESYPGCHITYATERENNQDEYYELLKNAPFIDSIANARLINRGKFDGYVDISSVCLKYEHSDLPLINRIDIFARAIGHTKLKNPVPFYRVEELERLRASQLTSGLGEKIVFYHTASFDSKRTWPVHNQLEFLRSMQRDMPHVKILLSDFNNLIPLKQQFGNCIDISGSTLREKAALIERADMFIGPDSGLMHVAGALNKVGLALFGSIPPAARINHYKNINAVVAEPKLSCQFCIYKSCNINYKCMQDITSRQVMRRIRELL